MHDAMQYDPMQGQALEFWKSFHIQPLSPPPFTMGAGK